MNSTNLIIVAEGKTEMVFVRDLLAPVMAQKGIYVYARLIGKPGHKGGDIRFDRPKQDIGNILKQSPDYHISTMFDYFRIDTDWPGRNEIQTKIKSGKKMNAGDKAEIIEFAMRKAIIEQYPDCNPDRRFIPYIEMHEFEAMLFSDAQILSEITQISKSSIQGILKNYNGPEEINENPEKAPSKQLEVLKKGYRKVAMGKAVSETIGIDIIRKKCPHFDAWLNILETLAG